MSHILANPPAADNARRPDPHAYRNGRRMASPANPAPAPRPDLRRLKMLRAAVERQPARFFYMGAYGLQIACGTTYCAAGCYAANYPGEGLELVWNPGDTGADLEADGKPGGPVNLAAHFGISHRDAEALFFGAFAGAPRLVDVSKAQVLQQIDRVIAKYAPSDANDAPPPPPTGPAHAGGLIDCATCYGAGRFDDGDACPDCGGTGVAMWAQVPPADAPAAAPPPTLGQLGGGSPYLPDAADYVPPADAADWLSDAGRNELASVPALCERIGREAPGVAVRVAVSFAVSRLPCGTVHFDRRPAWELTAWRGTEAYNGSGFDLERLAAFAAAKFKATAGKDGGR
jgi:hypothetical protein